MCIAIYAALFALLLFYSGYVIEQYALSISTAEQEWMVVALGWEMLPLLWPIGLLLMLVGSALTLFITRRLNRKREPQQA
jgi:membrane protein implicated in regulation of membrane protease activity